MTERKWLWALTAGLVILAIVVFARPVKTTVQQIMTGAAGSSIFESPELCSNGVCTWNQRGSIRAGTTTPWAVPGPSVASSTLNFAACQLDVASSSATKWDFAQASTRYATTSSLVANIDVGAGANGYIGYTVATTSYDASSNSVFPPNKYLVVGARGGFTKYADGQAGTGFTPSGTCYARWTYPQTR